MTRSSSIDPNLIKRFQRFLRCRWTFCYACISVFAILVFVSCRNNEKEDKEETPVTEDSVQTAKRIASEDSEVIFNNRASAWIGSSMETNVTDWGRFHLKEFWSDDSLEARPFHPERDFYSDYASVLRWSPDSSYVLDFGSYGHVKVKDKRSGKTTLEGGEPDTEVSLIDPKSNTRTRLLYLVPGATVFDGRWLDSAQVAVLGTYDENNDNHPDTVLWIINPRENFFRKYNWE